MDLYTCNGRKWVKYGCMRTMLRCDGIYLKYCENNHFEPVICVQDVYKKVCFNLCKVGNLPETQYMCRIQNNSKIHVERTSNSNNNCFTKYYKRKLSLQKKKTLNIRKICFIRKR